MLYTKCAGCDAGTLVKIIDSSTGDESHTPCMCAIEENWEYIQIVESDLGLHADRGVLDIAMESLRAYVISILLHISVSLPAAASMHVQRETNKSTTSTL